MGLFTKKKPNSEKTNQELEHEFYYNAPAHVRLKDDKLVLEYVLKKYPFLKAGEPSINDYFKKQWRLFLERNRMLY
jgi:hypothetical protein